MMTIKYKYTIALTFSVSICLVIGLFLFSRSNNSRTNAFIRLFPPHLAGYKGKLDLQFDSYYVAGLTDHFIYLGNSVATTQVIALNYLLTDTHHIQLHTPKKGTIAWGATIVHIDSPRVVMMEGIVPSILTGGFDTVSYIPESKTIRHFSKGLPVSGSSYILRVYDTSVTQNILAKYSLHEQGVFSNSYKMEKQLDGIFCTDGMFLYNEQNHFFMYVYYYRNQFIKLDTNLQVLFQSHTIDTISTAQIKVFTDSALRQSRMAIPPLYVNKRSAVSDKWLLVNSGLQASNENDADFAAYSVIDVYSAADGKYHFSFYLPSHRGKRLTSFAVRNNHLVAIYDNYVVSYILNF